ncbi:MAG: hypothetical protein WBA68_00730 [Alteraurantiacibacter sp.]
MPRLTLPLALLPLAACASVQDMAPPADTSRIAADGALVGIGQPVRVGPALLTPVQVTEDSRCPINARCVWAGEVKLRTLVQTAAGRQVVELTLGEPHSMAIGTFALVTVEPGQRASMPDIPTEQYRFVFEYR